jgi:hypothetical protein
MTIVLKTGLRKSETAALAYDRYPSGTLIWRRPGNLIAVTGAEEPGHKLERTLRLDVPPAHADDLGPLHMGAFMLHASTPLGHARRERSEAFEEHYRHATLFWNGLSVRSRAHFVGHARVLLGGIESPATCRRVVAQFQRVDGELARRVARGIRLPAEPSASTAAILTAAP